MSMPVIGIHGFKRSGKTTFGDMLEKKGCYTTSFAKRVYRTVQVMFNLKDCELGDSYKTIKHPEWGLTLREMLILVGHEMGRGLHSEYLWVQHVQQELGHISVCLPEYKAFVVTDVRYRNEAEWVRNAGTLVHLIRYGVTASEHESESGLPIMPSDLVVHNYPTEKWEYILNSEADRVLNNCK